MIISRVNPINVDPSTKTSSNKQLLHPVQSTTMGVRIGNHDVNIGYVQKFGWDQSRPSSEVYQIEPCVNGTFGGAMSTLMAPEISFFESEYFPGEVIEIIPGKAGAANITLARAVLYGSNLMSALMYIENAGTETTLTDDGTEKTALVFGGNAMQYVSLIQQVRPLFIKQVVYNPVDGGIIWGRVFEGAWIEDWSEEIPDASKNEIVVENMKIKAAKIRPYKINKDAGMTEKVANGEA